jgi:hypothetical protein
MHLAKFIDHKNIKIQWCIDALGTLATTKEK